MIFELRGINYNNTITIFLLLPIVFVFLMCLINFKKTKLFFKVFFSNEYFYTYAIESIFSLFNFLGFLTFLQIFSLIMIVFIAKGGAFFNDLLTNYLYCVGYVSVYFVFKFLAVKIFSFFINSKNIYKQMLVLETSYLASVAVLVYPMLCYAFLHLDRFVYGVNILFYSVLLFYVFRVILLFKNNKNLLSGHMFYIILYLCSLEILPFIYFFKRYIE